MLVWLGYCSYVWLVVVSMRLGSAVVVFMSKDFVKFFWGEKGEQDESRSPNLLATIRHSFKLGFDTLCIVSPPR